MKTLYISLITFMVLACSKEPEQDCSTLVSCTRVYYTYSTCTEGEYDTVIEKTVISEMSVCDTSQWHSDIVTAESTLYNSSGEDFRKFMKIYPSKCNCSR